MGRDDTGVHSGQVDLGLQMICMRGGFIDPMRYKNKSNNAY